VGLDIAAEPESAAAPRRTHRLTLIALVSGVLAVLGAMALPFAPLTMNQPEVSWPVSPAAPESTLLTLGAYTPLGFDATVSCRAIAAAGPAGTVLATVDTRQPDGGKAGFALTVDRGQLKGTLGGKPLFAEPLPTGACTYRITGDATGFVVTADGAERARAATLPEVDALITSVTALPGGTAADLSVRVRVDDQFNISPTPLKLVLITLMLLAAVVAIGCLVLLDRAVTSGPVPPRPWRLRIVDLVVPATMLVWLFLAPATDDDGYYSAMAKNVQYEGYVGNYYQLNNQGFTPFTWFYVFLSYWQRLFGLSPVVLRIPALLFGLVTWWAARRLVDGQHVLPAVLRNSRWGPIFVRTVLAGAFLAWWLPLDMGVRPEGVVTMCGVLVLLAVSAAVERQRLALVAAAVGIGSVGFLVHPTGFTALAPIIAGSPALWQLIRSGAASTRVITARVAAVLAPGAFAAFLSFTDGSIRDFIHGQELFLRVQEQEGWYSEYLRYQFLFQPDPMGNFAKRAAVVVCLVAVIWFVVLMAAARFRRVAVPSRLALAGWSTVAMFLLLWLTPSKWTHHFGALSGIGSVFLALFLVGFVPLVRQLTRSEKLPGPAVAAGVFSVLLAVALAGHGPNSWPYNWMFGMPHAAIPPGIWKFHFDSLALWALGFGVLAYLVSRWARRYKPDWRRYAVLMAIPVLVLVFFAVDVLYLLGSFGVATLRTWNTFSPSASAVRDPGAKDCVAGGAIDVLDESAGRPLATVSGAPVPGGFARNGWFPVSPPPGAQQGWGTGADPVATGKLITGWYELPAADPGAAVAVLAAGRLSTGNTLTVEYGRRGPTGVATLETVDVSDKTDSQGWRSIVLDTGRPAGADAIRLVAVDAGIDEDGWLSITEPAQQRFVPMEKYIPAGSAVAVSWQFAFLFPCERQPRYADGVVEPASYAVQWTDAPYGMLGENTWLPRRGGIFGQIPRTQSMTKLTARFRDFPAQPWMQVYRFVPNHPVGKYTLTTSEQTRLGWQAPK
jgi:arabinosyltransferase C